MARIAGINIPQNKLVHVGLTYIYGIGEKFSGKIFVSLSSSLSIKSINLLETNKSFFFVNWFLIAPILTPSVFLPESFTPSARLNLFPECYVIIGPFAWEFPG